MEHLHSLYKLLPCFCVLLARECRQNSDFGAMLINFTENPAADTFVNLHEDFYQAHKFDEYEVSYANLSGFDRAGLLSFRESFAVIAANKLQAQRNANRDALIVPFAKGTAHQVFQNLLCCL